MANAIEGAVAGMQTQGVSRLRGGAQVTYTQVQESPDNSKAESLGNWAKAMQLAGTAGEAIYSAKKKADMDKADERSNEIIRKLTPEQRREAIQNGTLLYKDDPYAMKALKEKTGRNAAFLIDDDVQQRIQQGQFRTRQDMEAYRQDQLTKGSKEYADQFGIKDVDEDYQRGFNSDITQRNIQLYGAHDNFLSEQFKKGNLVQSNVEIKSLLSSPEVLRSKGSGVAFSAYINNGLQNNSIPSDNQAEATIRSSLNDVTSREGGLVFLDNLEGQKVTLYGKQTSYRDLIGEEGWANLRAKANQTEYQQNAKRNEAFQVSIGEALNQADPAKGMEMIQAIKAQNDKIQTGEESTPQRQALINAELQMQERVKQDTAKRNQDLVKQVQSDNKALVFDQQYSKRINGEYVPTDYKNMPSNESTGTFGYDDAVNFANKKMNQIDAMNIPQEQKDRMKSQYLRADSENGPFRQMFATQVQTAAQEWQSAVINGQMPQEGTPAMDGLRKVMQADPTLMASLYPEQADLFNTMRMMDKMGVKPQVLIQAEQQARSQSKEMKFQADQNWAQIKNDSTSPELSNLPTSLEVAARKVYDSALYINGNRDFASQQVTDYLKENTTTFTGGNAEGKNKTIGVIPRDALQVTSDPDSWKQGKAIMDSAIQQIESHNNWATSHQLSVSQRGDSLYITDPTGNISVRYDKELLQRVYQDQQQKETQRRTDEALENANKRAPIAQVGKARAEARAHIQAKRNQIPKFIYGREDDE